MASHLLILSSRSSKNGDKSLGLGTVVFSHNRRYCDDSLLVAALRIHSCHCDGYRLRIAASDHRDTIALGSRK